MLKEQLKAAVVDVVKEVKINYQISVYLLLFCLLYFLAPIY